MVVWFAQLWKYYLFLTLFTLYASMSEYASGEISLMDIDSIGQARLVMSHDSHGL